MKIEVPQQLNTNTIAGDFNSLEAGIDESSLPFILEMLSKNFYSNPIGSIVREITSNCFDSHAEAGTDDAVIIKLDKDDEGDYVSFSDFGVGLSPERIRKVYMTYFTSTKRHTNNQIGGFGLGSKTPLSYTDWFYITTNFNKKKYQYLFSKGSKLPTLDLLSESDTEDQNGTEIRIYIKTNDISKFQREMGSQLCYFDNVYFEGCSIDNDYKIYEGKTFKFRSKDQYSQYMHICFGKVAYPIDWQQLNRPMLEIPVGVKFEISELIVTPNRESLRYTDEIIKLVNERIEETIKELTELYNNQCKEHSDFKEWWLNKKQDRILKLGENTLKLKGLKDLVKEDVFIPFKDFDLSLYFDKDPIDAIYNFTTYVDNGKISKNTGWRGNKTDYLLDELKLFYSKDTNYSALKNYNVRCGWIIHRRKYSDVFKSLVKSNYWDNEYKSRFIIKEKNKKGEVIDDGYSYFNLGFALRTYKLIKFYHNLVESKVKDYHGVISQDVIISFQRQKEENDYNLKRKINGEVHIKRLNDNIDFDWKISEIEKFKGLIVYGSLEDKDLLDKAHAFLWMIPTLRTERKIKDTITNTIHPEICCIIRIAKNNFKYFKNKPNMTHVKDLYGDNKLFRKVASMYKIEDILTQYLKNYSSFETKSFIRYMKNINQEIGERIEKLYNYHLKFKCDEGLKYTLITRNQLKKEILDIAYNLNLFDPSIEEDILVLNRYFEGVELLKHIDFNDETLPVILMYLRDKKKKLNFDYYTAIVPPTQEGDQLKIDFDPPSKEIKFKIITKAA